MDHKTHLVIVVANFHRQLSGKMLAAALAEIKKHSVTAAKVIHVAGSYEIPLITDYCLRGQEFDAAIVLGFIEKGETLHGQVMGQAIAQKLLEIQIEYDKPIGIGIIGPGATPAQARVRALPAAQGAVRAALHSLALLQKLKK